MQLTETVTTGLRFFPELRNVTGEASLCNAPGDPDGGTIALGLLSYVRHIKGVGGSIDIEENNEGTLVIEVDHSKKPDGATRWGFEATLGTLWRRVSDEGGSWKNQAYVYSGERDITGEGPESGVAKSFLEHVDNSDHSFNGWHDHWWGKCRTAFIDNSSSLHGHELLTNVTTYAIDENSQTWGTHETVETIWVDIQKEVDTVAADETQATIKLTPYSKSPSGYAWTSSPAGLVGSGSGDTFTYNPAQSTPGAYTVTCKAVGEPSCADSCVVNIVDVDIEQEEQTSCIHEISASLNLTNGCYSPSGYNWTSAPEGLSGSGSGSTYSYSPTNSNPGTYIVRCESVGAAGCYDECTVNIIKVEFEEEEYEVEWKSSENDNKWDAKDHLTSDSDGDNCTWTISGTPTSTIDSDGVVTFNSSCWYTDETDGKYVITATHNDSSSCSDSTDLIVVGALLCPDVLVQRLNMDVFNLIYGHWWIENGAASYGWWPVGLNEKMGEDATLTETLWNTFTGVDGELNGVTDYGGSATVDPHHGDTPDETIEVWIMSNRTRADAWSALETAASAFSGGWSWPFGNNCHSFQEDMLDAGEYMTESEAEDHFE